MQRYDAARMERSTRDLVARAAFLEVQAGRGTPHGGVWIDVSHLGAATVERNFRGMVKRCRDFGRDLAREPVEVGPTAHFTMGGVVIDVACRTPVEGLFAAGEDAGGVHGANRLGGNGVADSTVFGGLAGDRMVEWVVGRARPAVSRAAMEAAVARVLAPLSAAPTGEDLYALQARLRDVMWDRVGLIRSEAGLTAALAEIDEIAERAARVSVAGGPAFNLAWQDRLNLDSQLVTARLIALSALARAESRGSHFRDDFPEPNGELIAVHVAGGHGAAPRVWTESVRLTRYRPDAVSPAITVEVGD
jgi:succinate dehydrogenase / fumarate reductase flavoprotein subunit/fumarate reductase flavoprotein subunit